MPATAWAGLVQSQDLGNPSWSPTCVAGTQEPEPSSVASHGIHLQEAGLEAEVRLTPDTLM